MKSKNNRLIDFHVHLFPDRLFEAIWGAFVKDYGWEVQYQLKTDAVIEFLTKVNVEYIVYSNYAHRSGVAQELNRWNIKLLDTNPALFCFCAFHPGDDDALKMAADLLEHPRVMGFKLQHLVQDFYPHDERLFPLYELVIEKKKRILFHAGTGPVGNKYVGIDNFMPVMKRYPDLGANVAHMGGLEYRAFFSLLEIYNNLYFDTAFSFLPDMNVCSEIKHEELEQHKKRILYGSDFPNLIFPHELEIEEIGKQDISPEAKKMILYENGLRLLKETCPKAFSSTLQPEQTF